MYKNQLQELAQRSCFNLPAYSCIREGPDHAPRFKATVNFNGETFESPTFCSTLRKAEHAAAELALNILAKGGLSASLAARVLDKTGIYKNLLQETAHRAGLNLPVYTTCRSGLGHVPIFSSTVEIAGMNFSGEPARTKKQAQKNAAMVAWTSLRKLSQHHLSPPTLFPSESKGDEEQEQVIIARVLASLKPWESKDFSEGDHQHTQQSHSTSLELPMPGTYPVQFQSCGLSGFSPGVSMYHIWQQEQIIQQQNHLLALAIAPPIPSTPQGFPLMQSVLQSDYCLHIPVKESVSVPAGPRLYNPALSPSFYFSSCSVSDRNRSTVIIREIHEEKPENSIEFSQSEVPNFSNCDPGNKTRALRPALEYERQKRGVSESGSRNIEPHNPPYIDNFCPILRAYRKANANRSLKPPTSASSMIRTMDHASSAEPRSQQRELPLSVSSGMKTGVRGIPAMPMSARFDMVGAQPPSLSMAPPVRIRSVVPVCSAPPRKAIDEMSKSKN
ncbi:double-stranded RNA-binding protein 2-like isoform X2 [Prosopis cineraria]|nr:double-stranded RNA-binding protein 2-like isoform X2 [Prosopis cineraria]